MGGVGEVVRNLPAALAGLGARPMTLMPSYGVLHKAKGSRLRREVKVRFRHETHTVTAWSVPGSENGVRNVVLDHDLLAPGEPGRIYESDDDGAAPYATDADKFAFFCAAAAAFLDQRSKLPAVVHLHDWHTAMLAVLRQFDPRLDRLAGVPFVFTIHSLQYQGQRPLLGDVSSLAA
ncbi:MAG: glycogen/starch synthase, partial [Actinomycetota bacterium]